LWQVHHLCGVISTGKICFNKFWSGEILPFGYSYKISPLRSFLATVEMTRLYITHTNPKHELTYSLQKYRSRGGDTPPISALDFAGNNNIAYNSIIPIKSTFSHAKN